MWNNSLLRIMLIICFVNIEDLRAGELKVKNKRLKALCFILRHQAPI